MKIYYNIILLLLILMCCSCAKKIVSQHIPSGPQPGDELFAAAESKFKNKRYIEALDHYQDYFALYPDKPMAPAALFKIGAIYSTQKEYEKAQSAFHQITEDYPQSPYVADAIIEKLNISYKQGEYEAVIQEAARLKDDDASNDLIVRKYSLLAEAQIMLESPQNAILAIAEAYKRLDEPSSRNKLTSKLQDAIRQVSIDDLTVILNRLEDTPTSGYLLYHLGVKSIEENNYEGAIDVLKLFINRFPDHEDAETAKTLIKEILDESAYQHFTVGCLLPLTGRYENYGNKALKGIELAMQQFGLAGINPAIEVLIENTESDPEAAAQGVRNLAQEEVAAIIGPIITSSAAAKEAQALKIPIITLTQKDQITDIGDYVFRNFLTPKMQVETLANYAFETLQLKKFAVLYPDEKYGETFMNLFWDEVLLRGGEIVGVESYYSKNTDFAKPIKKLAGSYYEIPDDLKPVLEPEETASEADETQSPISTGRSEEKERIPDAIIDFDAIFIPDGYHKAGLILPQLVYYDVKNVLLLGTNLWHSDTIIDMAKQYVQGALIPEIFFAESASPAVQKFVKDFEAVYGEQPGFIEAVSYDTAMIMFEIISNPAIRFRASIKEALKNKTEFNGITGPTYFMDNGDAHKKLYLLRVKGKEFTEVRRLSETHQLEATTQKPE